MKSILILILQITFAVNYVNAQSACKIDYTGKAFCAPTGGSAIETVKGISCSPGRCTVDLLGYVKCSKEIGGGATTNSLGEIFCVGGCINPSAEYCVEMKNEKRK